MNARTPKPKAMKRTPLDPEPITLETLLTLEEVANHLGKTYGATRRMIQRGQIPAVKLGRHFRVRASAFAKYLDSLPDYEPAVGRSDGPKPGKYEVRCVRIGADYKCRDNRC
jgi:excisionase family DNA binding protein